MLRLPPCKTGYMLHMYTVAGQWAWPPWRPTDHPGHLAHDTHGHILCGLLGQPSSHFLYTSPTGSSPVNKMLFNFKLESLNLLHNLNSLLLSLVKYFTPNPQHELFDLNQFADWLTTGSSGVICLESQRKTTAPRSRGGHFYSLYQAPLEYV